MKRVAETEDLNLQDLIFILLFFFIIAQTLIVFKLEKFMPTESPKVDDEIKAAKDDKPEIITILIDHKSTVIALVAKTGRDTLIKGFDELDREEIILYCDSAEGKEEFLESEDAGAHKEIANKIKQVKALAGFTEPQLGLIADHRARYGTIFQVNLAVKDLVEEMEVKPGHLWKIRNEETGLVDDAELPSLLDAPADGA
ncbi:MAG: biopolymer transporter ExbD [Deltaproteobacteria bacterium]|nr:biopolymer transporter ExbD [Deltaproteobacteria bacterium]